MRLRVTPTFERTMNVDKRIVCFRGGTRSGKSYGLMQKVALWLWTGKISGTTVNSGIFSVTRSTLPALKATVLADFIDYLFELGIYQFISHIRTTNEFIFQGRKVVFFSLDDSHKLRGRQHDFLWINECTDTSFDIFNQGIMRLNHQMFLDYNPQGEPWVKTEIEEKRLKDADDVHLDISVYTDNPFLPDPLIKEIQYLEKVDNDLWRIYTKGEWVSLQGLIYPNVKVISKEDFAKASLSGRDYYGMDFGYNDPSVLVRVVLQGDNLYVDTLVHESGMLLDEMAKKMKEHIRQSDTIYCDYAEPRTIEELKKRGIKAVKAPAKDVLRSIGFIKQHHIHVTDTSVKTLKEWTMFKWAEDKDGRLIDKPINYAKHSSDAVSYAIGKALGSKIEIL